MRSIRDLFPCGSGCTCDSCQGIVWPPPRVLTPEEVEKIKKAMRIAGHAWGLFAEREFMKVISKEKKETV